MDLNREIRSLLGTIAKAHGSNHVTLGSDADARTTALAALRLDLLPKMALRALHLHRLRIGVNLRQYLVDLFQFKIYDIIHDTLGHLHMLLKEIEIKLCMISKRIFHIRI